jgi:hypothetical protein
VNRAFLGDINLSEKVVENLKFQDLAKIGLFIKGTLKQHVYRWASFY